MRRRTQNPVPYCPCLMETDRDTLPCVADNGSTDTGTECFLIFLLVSMISQFLFLKYKAKLSDYVEVFTIISDVGH